MDIKWLRTFVTAAHYQNFRKAAEVLFVAQPTVTVHMKQLEETIGTPLFERKGRNVVLTQAGHRFLPHAKLIIDRYDYGLHDILSWKQGYYNKLTLAVSPLVAASILPPIVRKFIKQNPHIEVVTHVVESKAIIDTVSQGEADLGLSRIRPMSLDLTCMKLYDDPVVLVAPHDGGDFESSPPIDVQELLTKQTILTYNHPEYWDDLLAELRRYFQHIRTMVVSQVHITKRFIEEGLGVSFLPRSTIRRELIEGRMLEVHTDKLSLPVASTYLVYKHTSLESESFIHFLHSQFN